MNTDRDELAGEGQTSSSRRVAKRESVSSEGKFAAQFSKKILTRQDDLSEDSGSRKHGADTPSGLRTSRSRRQDDEHVKPKIDFSKVPPTTERQTNAGKKP
jgi:hypothetical protein